MNDELGLPVYLMTTGSRGIQVVVPLQRNKTFDEVSAFSQSIAHYLENKNSEEITMAQRKVKGGNKLFIDTTRNPYGQTTVAPYGVRPKEGAPVATPINWDELLPCIHHSITT